jgi:hypothetical protein
MRRQHLIDPSQHLARHSAALNALPAGAIFVAHLAHRAAVRLSETAFQAGLSRS